MVYSHSEVAGFAEVVDGGTAAAAAAVETCQSLWNLWTLMRTACFLRSALKPASWPGPFSPPGSEDEARGSDPLGSRGSAGPDGTPQERDRDAVNFRRYPQNVCITVILDYLHGGGSFFGVPLQHVLHQGDGLVAGVGNESFQRGRHALGEAEVHG